MRLALLLMLSGAVLPVVVQANLDGTVDTVTCKFSAVSEVLSIYIDGVDETLSIRPLRCLNVWQQPCMLEFDDNSDATLETVLAVEGHDFSGNPGCNVNGLAMVSEII